MERYLTADEIDLVKRNGFNENGLRFSIDELKEIQPTNLVVHELEKYVDAITFAKVSSNDVDFFKDQLVPIPEGATVKVTATGLGNLAYIALHMKDLDCRMKANLLFKQIASNYGNS